MIGTMLGVLFVCLLGTVPIAVSLGLSCVATFSVFNACLLYTSDAADE